MAETGRRIIRAIGEGFEVPVIDITNPAFAAELDEAGLDAELERFMAEETQRQKTPQWLTRLMLWVFARRSYLVKAMARARAGYLPGLTTYYLKLGAANLPPPLDDDIDRQIVRSLAARSARLRLEQVARLLAEELVVALAARPGAALHFVNIAGGPAMDSLNALILMAESHRELLDGRAIRIDILDIDPAGPAFARRALAGLQEKREPLAGLAIEFGHLSWNWRDLAGLTEFLTRGRAGESMLAISSEGGLFEYGSDSEIAGVLETLRRGVGEDAVFAGSVTRGDAATRLFRRASPFPIVPRGLEAFSALAAAGGWQVAASRRAAFSDQVLLHPRP